MPGTNFCKHNKMSDNQYQSEIERLEREREELLQRLSPEERSDYEAFKKKFTETNHGRDENRPLPNDHNF